ncbi:hypothetical protein CSB07_01200 [Candidatus Gracilibacteria bacterium]|nr:MAG: hypothetical protein CSB07_01200 [Candidatus Gracilibacteria bacterium]PIE85597.1 MAG: hypothetical protein CSA08_01145 [Candidatus Gracilibacteria bacterium]
MQNQTIIKPRYKNIPHIGIIPEDWEVKNLGEMGKFYRGHSYNSTNVVEDGLLVLRSSNIKNGKLILDKDLQFVNNECNTNIKLKNQDLVICMANGSKNLVGKTAQYKGNYNKPITVGAFCSIFRMTNTYSKNLFNSPKYKEYLYVLLAGTNINNLKTTNLEKLKFAIPKSFQEQQKIGKILNTCDSQIETTKQIIQKIELRNKGLQQQLLTGRKRLPGFTEEWNELPLSKCLNYEPRGIPKPTENYLSLGIRSHGKGIFHKPNSNPKDIAMEELFVVKEHDLVINITFAWEQAIAIASKEDEGGLVSHRFPTYTFKRDKAIHEYFKYLIIQKYFKYKLDLISPGGAGRNRVLSKREFLKMKVIIPKVEEQKAIANVLEKANEQLNEYKEKLEKLEIQKKGLMQNLLTGKIRVKL